MSLLHLVRHGQASAGTEDYDRLSPVGQEQSQILGRWWQSQGFSPKAVFHGTLLRQRDTASFAMQALVDNAQAPPMQAHAGLNEYDHRIIESHFAPNHADYIPESMSFDDYTSIIQRWQDHSADSTTHPDIEPWEDFKARGWNTLHELSHHGTDDTEFAFFTSGGVIATVLATVLDLNFEHTVDAIWRIRNASITSFHLNAAGEARLIEFNAVPHLLEQRKPHLITMI